jgi:hypothetical protein
MASAATVGTAAHAMAEADITGQDVDLGTEDADLIARAQVAFEGYLTWKRMSALKLIAAEVALVDDKLGYGGTLDAVGVIEGKPALIDFKTSNHVRDSHILQLAAYANLWEQAHPDLRLTGGYHLLKFNKETGGFSHHQYPYGSLLPAWEAFKCCLTLHGLKKVVGGLT